MGNNQVKLKQYTPEQNSQYLKFKSAFNYGVNLHQITQFKVIKRPTEIHEKAITLDELSNQLIEWERLIEIFYDREEGQLPVYMESSDLAKYIIPGLYRDYKQLLVLIDPKMNQSLSDQLMKFFDYVPQNTTLSQRIYLFEQLYRIHFSDTLQGTISDPEIERYKRDEELSGIVSRKMNRMIAYENHTGISMVDPLERERKHNLYSIEDQMNQNERYANYKKMGINMFPETTEIVTYGYGANQSYSYPTYKYYNET